mmetsp:Transcript_14122/g.14297  ORF Transcript_14122/g.14297 Transcript_14122/m.14297 type:complete len:89 (-) Transcript_14122:635-901(-)
MTVHVTHRLLCMRLEKFEGFVYKHPFGAMKKIHRHTLAKKKRHRKEEEILAARKFVMFPFRRYGIDIIHHTIHPSNFNSKSWGFFSFH